MTEKSKKLIDLTNELRWEIGDNFHDKLTEGIYTDASEIAAKAVVDESASARSTFDIRIDKIVTSKTWGFPIMIGVLSIILWLTIEGANYPSGMLFTLLIEMVYPLLKQASASIGVWPWLDGLLITVYILL